MKKPPEIKIDADGKIKRPDEVIRPCKDNDTQKRSTRSTRAARGKTAHRPLKV
jgi:hypothetical protein